MIEIICNRCGNKIFINELKAFTSTRTYCFKCRYTPITESFIHQNNTEITIEDEKEIYKKAFKI